MATLINRMMSLVRPGIDSKAEFYAGKTITEVEWWISYACQYPETYWGRLRVFSDGSADAAFDEANVYGFDNREYAGYFLAEDEYTPFASGGSVFRNLLDAAEGALNRAAASTQPLDCFSNR